MFATILRRWRLVTPLALAVLAIAVVASGLVGQTASAHNYRFHFFGRAYALGDNSTVIPDTACDTGFISIRGGSLDTGHCFGVDGQGEPGAGQTGSGRLESIFSDSTVVTSHGHQKGQTLAKVDMEEAAGAHNTNLHGCTAPFNGGPGSPGFNTAITAVSNSPCIYDGPTAPRTGGNSPDGPNAFNSCARFTAGRVFSLLDDSFGNAHCSDTLFWADLIQVAAVAECHSRLDGTTSADVKAAIELSDAAVREDNGLHFIGPQGSVGPAGQANTTFAISGFTFGELIIRDIVVIINEQKIFEEGSIAAIRSAAVHLIGTDDDGFVKFNFVLGFAFAGIHCARHLPSDDTLAIPS